MLLVGDKPAILISAVYSIFYLTVALDLFTLIEIPRIVPVRRQIYVDRVIELVLITGGSYVYHKVFIIQKAALREHERIAAERHSLQSVSHLADGVAHEINNPLSIIWMTTQRLSDRNWVLADGKASLEKIMDASQRIGQFVHCIQMLTTPRVGSVEVVNIGILVNSAFDRSLAALPSLRNPRLKPDIAGDVMIRCHEESLRTVLIEIFTNAIEAAHLVTEPQIEVGLTREKRHWHLTIADNGVEFDHSLMDSFVRPFYTTKFDRPRRGLGLTTSQFLLARMSWGLRFERRQGLTIASVTIPDVDVTVTAENKRVA
jgi:signal transduction histidine kinase